MANKNYFLISIISINLIFIALVIYKKSYISHINYKKQMLEKELENLKKDKKIIEEQLLMLQKPEKIKKFCTQRLGLQDMKMNQIKPTIADPSFDSTPLIFVRDVQDDRFGTAPIQSVQLRNTEQHGRSAAKTKNIDLGKDVNSQQL